MKSSLIFLYGPPGSGKTTIGKLLAADLNLPFHDLDDEIIRNHGITIPEIFSSGGEKAFRQIEKNELQKLLAFNTGVITLGGGTLLDSANRDLVEENGSVVLLSAAEETLLFRLKQDEHQRPLLSTDLSTKLSGLMNERSSHYSSFENQIDTTDFSPGQISSQIQIQLGRFHVPEISKKSKGYDVLVQSAGLDHIGGLLTKRQLKSPIMIVSDENVSRFYLKRVEESLRTAGYETQSFILPPGEQHKNIQQVASLWDALLSAGLERGSTVVSLGGGVVSDLAGFAAATYLRGIQWVVVPTSLLSMIDAGLGGKTGFDLPRGKNLIGAFHSPALVLVDPEILFTLPQDEFRSGLAEVVKHGIINDPYLYQLCQKIPASLDFRKDPAFLNEIIKRAIAVKVQVIKEDPYEQGRRAVLNLGHTIGHAVELVSGFKIRHGEAVAIGMVAEARLAEEINFAQSGLTEEIKKTLILLGLPTQIPANLDIEEILLALSRDKKRFGGKVRFALPVSIGNAAVGIEIDEWRIRNAISISFART
jgi:shikimate kinase / 3-dehydroquinate synthase